MLDVLRGCYAVLFSVGNLAQTIHGYLLRRPILSSGGTFLVRPPRRTASTPPAGFGLERLATAFMNIPGLGWSRKRQ